MAEAAEHLLQVFYGADAHQIRVTCQTEVSEQYHLYLQTREQSKEMSIAAIEQYTHTTIEFPNTTSNESRRTSVTITGTPSQVCQARKLFDVSRSIDERDEGENDENVCLVVFTDLVDFRNSDQPRTEPMSDR